MTPSIINSQLSDSPDITILTAKYDDTSSYVKGASHGPDKVLECFHSQLEIFDRVHKKLTSYLLKIAHEDLGELNGSRPEDVFSRIKSVYKEVLDMGSFPILIGGEHSVSIGALSALAEKVDPTTVTVVQVDAHFDLRDDDSDYNEHPTKFAHSAVMRRIHEMGFNLVQIGIRSYSKEEYDYAYSHPDTISVFEWGSKIPTVSDIISTVKTKDVYFTVDIDGIDPAQLPGTGTPVPGGLEWYYFFNLMNELFTQRHVLGADVVEISPQKEFVVTEFGAAQIAYTMCGYIDASAKKNAVK